MPFTRSTANNRTVVRNPAPAPAPAPAAPAAAPSGATATDMLRSIVGLAPNTGNYSLSDAINQLKAGNVSNQQNIMQGLVGKGPNVGTLANAVQAGRSAPAMPAPAAPSAPAAPMGRPAMQQMGRPAMQQIKKGGKVQAKGYSSGGKVSSASKRADGIAQRGKTRGKFV